MVVRLDLAEDVDVLVVRGVLVGLRVDVETATTGAGEDGGVVFVGGEDAFAVERVGVLDHLEQRLVLGGTVDVPGGVENLMAAVLGIRLREHHELDVVRVATEGGEGGDEVIDLVLGEREAEGGVGGDEGGAAFGEHGHARHWAGGGVGEKNREFVQRAEDFLRHPVVDEGGDGRR